MSLYLIFSAISLILADILTGDEYSGPSQPSGAFSWSGVSCWWVSKSALESCSYLMVSSLGSTHSPSEVRMLLNFTDLRPDMSFHWENAEGLTLESLPVSNKLSNRMWNCGETHHVCRLRIKATDYVCLGEGTRLIPSLALSYHLGFHPPACR